MKIHKSCKRSLFKIFSAFDFVGEGLTRREIVQRAGVATTTFSKNVFKLSMLGIIESSGARPVVYRTIANEDYFRKVVKFYE